MWQGSVTMNDLMKAYDDGRSVFLLIDLERALKLINSNPRYIGKLRSIIEKSEKALGKLKELDLQAEIEQILPSKEEFYSKLELYLDKACETIESNHGECYYAKDADELISILETILKKDDKILVTMSSEIKEIDLPNRLKDKEYNIFYSKISELIGEIIGLKYPSMYSLELIDEDTILEKLNNFLKLKLSSLDEALEYLGEYVKNIYEKADVAITGADAISADTGSIFIVDTEGDVRPLTGAPREHIIIAGIDKIYPNYMDAWNATYIKYHLSYVRKPTNINIISGPSKTGDIEKVITYGAHGPEKLVVILLDNRRKETIIDGELKAINNCIECGLCMYSAPIVPGITGNISHPIENFKEFYYRFLNKSPELESTDVVSALSYIFKKMKIADCPFNVDYSAILKKLKIENLNPKKSLQMELDKLIDKLTRRVLDKIE